MRRAFAVVGVVLIFIAIFYFISYVIGIGFGRLQCNEFRYVGKVVKCGPVVQFDNGTKKYLVKIGSIKYFDRGFELEYLTNFDSNKWWSKYFYLKNRAIFTEKENYQISVLLQKRAVIEFSLDNNIYESSLDTNGLKNFFNTMGGKVKGSEAVITIKLTNKSRIFFKDRLSSLVQIALTK